MFKKIIVCSLIVAISCFAAEKKDNALYKDLLAGEKVSKYPTYFKNSEPINCKEIGVPVGDIAKCLIVSDNESLGTESGFSMVIATIDEKINSVHLVKTDEPSSLTPNFWSTLFKSDFKLYATFNPLEGLPVEATLKNNNDFLMSKISLENKLMLEQKSFLIDTVLFDTPLKIGENINFVKTLKTKPENITRMVEVIESFDNESQTWLYRVDFTNPLYQAALQELYKKKHKIAEGGI